VTGHTCSRACRTSPRPTGGSAGCGARSSCSAATWPPSCRRWLPADRHLRAAGQAPSRVRGSDGWAGLGNDLAARFGRDAAHAEWFYGFRLAIRTDLGSRIVRAWAIVAAAVNERDAGADLLATGPPPPDLLADKGFAGAAFAAAQAARGTAVLVPPGKHQRATMPAILRKIIAEWRNRIEATFAEITDQMELARHGAHTFWGLLTRTAATIAAHTLLRLHLTRLSPPWINPHNPP
jgi:Transposase DDE domain